MTAAGNMTMRANIERNADTATDADGHPEKPNFQEHNQIPCRVFSKMRREVTDEEKIVMIEDLRGRFQRDADLTEDDRILSVVDRQNNVLFAGPLAIRALIRRRTYVEAVLERFAA